VEGISLYVHLPYCESLCTYCGCNTRITVDHRVEGPYIDAVLSEWTAYRRLLGKRPLIKEIHLGGGTPTFFSPEQLRRLITGLLEGADVSPDHEFGFEGHPANTSREHLQVLYDLGFRRVSFGIQDFDPKVQDIIHRFQSVEQVEDVTAWSREIGYTSINYDLVYGLPCQTPDSVRQTLEVIRRLLPDRIAFYSYAHVPWIKPGQRRFTEADLPEGEAKRKLYELGRSMLEDAGYREIGMDHFALESDSLFRAERNGTLHRNFMGYTTTDSRILIGLGVSSISDCWTAFAQNVKTVEGYLEQVRAGRLPVFRGHFLDREDQVLRKHILQLMCRLKTDWSDPAMQVDWLERIPGELAEMEQDGLVRLLPQGVEVTPAGRAFIRNVCMAFDARLWRKQPATSLFSMTV
jgi:oxygen-independent coproporphyrinogen-3 oxidase